MVYVISSNGQPLMPTKRHGKVRRLLRDCKAKVVKRCPFTIQLLYVTTNVVQAVTLGVDAGSKVVGLSATTEKKVLFESEVELRNDIVKLLASRRELRRGRRYRKSRYRKPRFNNRVHTKKNGWLAPSVQHKVKTHLTAIRKVYEILPISKIVVEVALFDIQKIRNSSIRSEEYQQGEQLGFWNVREYVLWRDGHVCKCCHGKSKDKVLNIHHIESRQTGGDAPNNLVTLCETCHTKFHKGEIGLPKEIKRGTKFDNETFMGIMRWTLYDMLKERYKDVSLTYGYITKHVRIQGGLPKKHYVDARCISGNPLATPNGVVYYQRKIRRHNRQLYKVNTCKGGIRKANQAPYIVKGFRLFDKVSYKNQTCFIFGRRSSGYFDLRLFDGTKISTSALVKDIKLIDMRKGFLMERRNRFPLTTKVASV